MISVHTTQPKTHITRPFMPVKQWPELFVCDIKLAILTSIIIARFRSLNFKIETQNSSFLTFYSQNSEFTSWNSVLFCFCYSSDFTIQTFFVTALFCNSKFISRNSAFISCNSEFISRNSAFISCNSEFISYIYIIFFIQWWKQSSIVASLIIGFGYWLVIIDQGFKVMLLAYRRLTVPYIMHDAH